MSNSGQKRSRIWGIYAEPGVLKWVLRLLPFITCLLLYNYASQQRHAENPQDKLMPSWEQMANKTKELATEPNKRTDKLVFWNDTKTSL